MKSPADETGTPVVEQRPAPAPLFGEEPFSRNIPTISAADQERLAKSTACVVGCGGLGGFICEFLVRLGVGHLVAVDADVFAPSNLNRQVLATRDTLGRSKALCAAERARAINPEVRVDVHEVFLDQGNARELIAGADVVVDALDNPASRVVLEAACEGAGLVLVHGAVRGQLAQVAVIHPGEGTLARIYEGHTDLGGLDADALRTLKSTLSFTPPLAASLEVAEALKVLLGQERGIGAGELVLVDARRMTMQRVRL